MRARLLALVLTLVGTWCSPLSASGRAVDPLDHSRDDVAHRVVWDVSARGGPAVELMSANLDGSDQRLIYRRKKGWILWLVLNRAGTEVAMAPFPGVKRRSTLVTVDTLSGEHRDVLRGQPRFDYIGAVGWSPDGRSLAFEGRLESAKTVDLQLWTIHRDGTGLRKRTQIRNVPNRGGLGVAIAWMDEGIFYTEVGDLMRYHRGKATRVLKHARWVRPSGDGRYLFVERFDRTNGSLWRMHPDGTGLERFVRRTRPHPKVGYLLYPVPDFTGDLMLGVVDGPAGQGEPGFRNVVFPTTRSPRPSDPSLDFVSSYIVAWN